MPAIAIAQTSTGVWRDPLPHMWVRHAQHWRRGFFGTASNEQAATWLRIFMLQQPGWYVEMNRRHADQGFSESEDTLEFDRIRRWARRLSANEPSRIYSEALRFRQRAGDADDKRQADAIHAMAYMVLGVAATAGHLKANVEIAKRFVPGTAESTERGSLRLIRHIVNAYDYPPSQLVLANQFLGGLPYSPNGVTALYWLRKAGTHSTDIKDMAAQLSETLTEAERRTVEGWLMPGSAAERPGALPDPYLARAYRAYSDKDDDGSEERAREWLRVFALQSPEWYAALNRQVGLMRGWPNSFLDEFDRAFDWVAATATGPPEKIYETASDLRSASAAADANSAEATTVLARWLLLAAAIADHPAANFDIATELLSSADSVLEWDSEHFLRYAADAWDHLPAQMLLAEEISAADPDSQDKMIAFYWYRRAQINGAQVELQIREIDSELTDDQRGKVDRWLSKVRRQR